MASFVSLPSELVALIATQCTAQDWFSLSRVSKLTRNAINNAAVVRDLLVAQHKRDYTTPWSLEAVAKTAGTDLQIWLRFALAAHLATSLTSETEPAPEHHVVNAQARPSPEQLRADPQARVSPGHLRVNARRGPFPGHLGAQIKPAPEHEEAWSPWLAELALSGHPVVAPKCSLSGEHATTFRWQELAVFDALVVLHGAEATEKSKKLKLLGFCAYGGMLPNGMLRQRYFTQCIMGTVDIFIVIGELARQIRTRRDHHASVWPYNSHANAPEAALPRPSLMGLGSSDIYGTKSSLPVPFANASPSLELPNWEDWWNTVCSQLLDLEDFLFSGVWQGYYCHDSYVGDPPMLNIRFRRKEEPDSLKWERYSSNGDQKKIYIEALGAHDGHDRFSLRGLAHLYGAPPRARIVLDKSYQSVAATWTWHCNLTPFGIIGHWADENTPSSGEHHGAVWLWKREWTSDNAPMI